MTGTLTRVTAEAPRPYKPWRDPKVITACVLAVVVAALMAWNAWLIVTG
jgi:hypothetical protein